MEKIITIPNAAEGIYRVVFTGGSPGDVVSVGFQEPISWGILPQDIMYFTATQTNNEWYFYVPKKFKLLSMGIGGSGAVATIWSADGSARVAATAASTGTANSYRKRVDVTSLTPDTVYKLELPKNFRGVFGIQGISQLLCPTPEMARDLQGGYVYYSDAYGDWQFEGPLQVKARQRMVEIYEELGGDFSIDMDSLGIPEEAPTEGLDNPRAEAMLFGAYFGSIVGMKDAMFKQCLDPSNPWFGGTLSTAQIEGTEAMPDGDWQERYYHGGGKRATRTFVGALTINAETNYWYGNPTLAKRVELQWLYWIQQMNVGGYYTYANPSGQGCSYYFRTYENFQFGEQGWPHGYYYTRNFMSPQTKAITDNGFQQMAEGVMTHRGQGVNNQMLMGVQGTLYTYLWTGDEFFHEWFARDVDGVVYPSSRPTYIGQTSPQGYWQEGAGSDGGSYGRMNEGMWDDMVLMYLTLPEDQQRPEVVEDLRAGTERYLLWDSQWYCPPVNGFPSRPTNAGTTRNPSAFSSGSAIIGNAYIQNMFPRAMANHDAQVAGVKDPDTFNEGSAGTVASIIMCDDWAYRHLKEYWPKYKGRYANDRPDSYTANDSWSMYKAYHEGGKWFEYDEIPVLPFALEGDYNLYDIEGGSIAGKHDGLYVLSYYNNDLGNKMNGYSWITPGPCLMWDEYFGTLISARKPTDYTVLNGSSAARNADGNNYKLKYVDNDLVHTTIIGKDGGGQLFAEGKGEAVFKWIEEGKSWSITHTDPFSLRATTWKYFMSDEGWSFEAGFDAGVTPQDDMWVQLPVVNITGVVEGAELIYDAENSTLTWSHDGHTTTLSWDKGTESKMETKLGEESPYRFLKIKLTPDKPVIKFSFAREMGDYKLVRGIRDGK